MTENKILDLLERAFKAGCFTEVLKLIRSKSSIVMIEQVIKKSEERHNDFDFDFDGLFGAD